jgi:hypothetical protein
MKAFANTPFISVVTNGNNYATFLELISYENKILQGIKTPDELFAYFVEAFPIANSLLFTGQNRPYVSVNLKFSTDCSNHVGLHHFKNAFAPGVYYINLVASSSLDGPILDFYTLVLSLFRPSFTIVSTFSPTPSQSSVAVGDVPYDCSAVDAQSAWEAFLVFTFSAPKPRGGGNKGEGAPNNNANPKPKGGAAVNAPGLDLKGEAPDRVEPGGDAKLLFGTNNALNLNLVDSGLLKDKKGLSALLTVALISLLRDIGVRAPEVTKAIKLIMV